MPDPKPTRNLLNIELLLGISATLLSLCALVVSVFQTGIAREQTEIARQQQHASVWPHVQVHYSQNSEEFTWSVLNNGVGPALIKAVELRYRAKRYASHAELVSEQLTRLPTKGTLKAALDIAEIGKGSVVRPEGEIMLERVRSQTAVVQALREMIMDSSFRYRVVYSDVYGNCWQNDRDVVTPLPDCPPN